MSAPKTEAAATGPRPRADRMALALAALVALTAWGLGASQLEVVATDQQSETATLHEARELAAGRQRFGIVEYTHYPNGPLYVVAALTRAGLSPPAIRHAPLALSALAFGFMALALLVAGPARPAVRTWVVASGLLLLLQPSAVMWMGALHEHSYAFTLVMTLVATSALVPDSARWVLFPLGFVAGWIGYDWIPLQAAAVLVTRWLVLARDPATPLAGAAAHAALDAFRFASGVALAVLAHLAQLALYFESFDAASRDLLGSAATRANADAAGAINPEYQQSIAESTRQLERAYAARGGERLFGPGFSFDDPPRLKLSWVLYKVFAMPRWSQIGLLLLATGLGTAMTVALAWRERAPARIAAVGGVAAALALLSPAIWVFLMPQHAVMHLHILPRHGLVPFTLLFAIPPLLFARSTSGSPPPADLRRLLWAAAPYAPWPAMLLACGLHALLVLG